MDWCGVIQPNYEDLFAHVVRKLTKNARAKDILLQSAQNVAWKSVSLVRSGRKPND
jgi:hypothetical protein